MPAAPLPDGETGILEARAMGLRLKDILRNSDAPSLDPPLTDWAGRLRAALARYQAAERALVVASESQSPRLEQARRAARDALRVVCIMSDSSAHRVAPGAPEMLAGDCAWERFTRATQTRLTHLGTRSRPRHEQPTLILLRMELQKLSVAELPHWGRAWLGEASAALDTYLACEAACAQPDSAALQIDLRQSIQALRRLLVNVPGPDVPIPPSGPMHTFLTTVRQSDFKEMIQYSLQALRLRQRELQ